MLTGIITLAEMSANLVDNVVVVVMYRCFYLMLWFVISIICTQQALIHVPAPFSSSNGSA
jgi:hypothetical protein